MYDKDLVRAYVRRYRWNSVKTRNFVYQLQGREMEIWTNFSLESCGEMHEEQVWTWHRPLISIVGRRLITAHKVHKGET